MTMSTTSQSQHQPRPTSSKDTTRHFKSQPDYNAFAPEAWPNNAAPRRRQRRKQSGADTVPVRETLSSILASNDNITLFPHSSGSTDSRSSSSDSSAAASLYSESTASANGSDRESRSPGKDSPGFDQREQKEARIRRDSPQ